jgi:hypothetical protein
VLVAAALTLLIAVPVLAVGPIGTAAGFEDDDANLVVNSTMDWNGFTPVSWVGVAPFQNASKQSRVGSSLD